MNHISLHYKTFTFENIPEAFAECEKKCIAFMYTNPELNLINKPVKITQRTDRKLHLTTFKIRLNSCICVHQKTQKHCIDTLKNMGSMK